MNGHPVGSLVVITWTRPGSHAELGSIHTVTSEPYVYVPGGKCQRGFHMPKHCNQWAAGLVIQDIDATYQGRGGWRNLWLMVEWQNWHPVDWMRPLSDPDQASARQRRRRKVSA